MAGSRDSATKPAFGEVGRSLVVEIGELRLLDAHQCALSWSLLDRERRQEEHRPEVPAASEGASVSVTAVNHTHAHAHPHDSITKDARK